MQLLSIMHAVLVNVSFQRIGGLHPLARTIFGNIYMCRSLYVQADIVSNFTWMTSALESQKQDSNTYNQTHPLAKTRGGGGGGGGGEEIVCEAIKCWIISVKNVRSKNYYRTALLKSVCSLHVQCTQCYADLQCITCQSFLHPFPFTPVLCGIVLWQCHINLKECMEKSRSANTHAYSD